MRGGGRIRDKTAVKALDLPNGRLEKDWEGDGERGGGEGGGNKKKGEEGVKEKRDTFFDQNLNDRKKTVEDMKPENA